MFSHNLLGRCEKRAAEKRLIKRIHATGHFNDKNLNNLAINLVNGQRHALYALDFELMIVDSIS